ncbi:MAG: AAA family ATPase [Clostridia bacterium]|nr:AAA family ATPase [Clostridia bacterium]
MSKLPTLIPTLSVDRTVSILSSAYISAVKTGTPFKKIPSVMLWGPPGVGKSQAIRQVAKEIERETGKRCVVTDVRLLLFNPIDLRGIPTANADKTLAVWLKPQIFQMDESPSVVNILFLDEISAAPQSVQAAAYQITLDRIVGEHKLPDNCIVLAAGNRVTDKSVAFKMPKALANRFCHMEVESNFDSWRRWAVESGVSPKVVGFLSFKHDYLIQNESEVDNLAFPTPRSWEMVSNLLNMVNQDHESIYQMIAGCVGSGVAGEFNSWCRVFKTLPSIEDIFNGRCNVVPKTTDALYALVSSMVSYAREHKDKLRLIENSIEYSNKLPADFSVVLIRNYMAIEPDYRDRLMTLNTFKNWVRTRGKFLNGV